jgi:CheY-like chemotaxis protein
MCAIRPSPKGPKSHLRYADSVATVLLASDLSSLRRELEMMLAGPDILIEETSSGPETIERVKRGDVDLVVVDLQIGAMGGMAITT